MTTAFLAFSVVRFTSLPRPVALPVVAVVLGVVLFTELCQTLTTALQGIASVFLAYIVHFVHVHIPFRLVHLENAVLALLCIAATLFKAQDPAWRYRTAFAELWFIGVILAIDEVVLARHHLTRGGFTTIERPADINWAAERDHAETIRLLNREEEANMERSIGSDFVISVFAFIAIFIDDRMHSAGPHYHSDFRNGTFQWLRDDGYLSVTPEEFEWIVSVLRLDPPFLHILGIFRASRNRVALVY
jgi:hypothetical protein